MCIFLEMKWLVELFVIELFKENFEVILIVVFGCFDEECEIELNSEFKLLFGFVVEVCGDLIFLFMIDEILLVLIFCFDKVFFIIWLKSLVEVDILGWFCIVLKLWFLYLFLLLDDWGFFGGLFLMMILFDGFEGVLFLFFWG